MPETAEEKTEQPTSRRLSKAKEGGNLPQSPELLSAVALIALAGTSVVMGPKFVQWAKAEITQGFMCQRAHIASPEAFLEFISLKITGAFLITVPFLLALVITGTGNP